MRHALATWEVRDLLLIPSFMLTAKAPRAQSSEKRNSKPLASSASWRLNPKMPEEVRAQLVTPGSNPSAKSKPRNVAWTLDVLRVIQSLGKIEFTTTDAYIFERELEQLHPDNQNIKAT